MWWKWMDVRDEGEEEHEARRAKKRAAVGIGSCLRRARVRTQGRKPMGLVTARVRPIAQTALQPQELPRTRQ